MSARSNHILIEEMTKKHGKGTGQKCNFKYLMDSKTNRSMRNGSRSKENEIESVLLSSAHKYATKTGRLKTASHEPFSLVSPLSAFDVHKYNIEQDEGKGCFEGRGDNCANTRSNSDAALDTKSNLSLESKTTLV
jgi:hypothetical protein